MLDLLTAALLGARPAAFLSLSLLTVAGTWVLARRLLDRRGALLAGGFAALSPPLVWSGTFWNHAPLTTAATVGTAVLLTDLLGPDRPPARRAVGLALATFLLVVSDWPAWAPALAWLGWLLAFPPDGPTGERLRAPILGLSAGLALALPVYLLLSARGADPVLALSAHELPLGVDALYVVLDALAGLLVGRSRDLPPSARVAIAGLVLAIATAAVSRTRARRPDLAARLQVPVVGAIGAFVPALAMQPWIPVAVDKHVWYGAPLLCVLLAAALRPPAALDLGPDSD